MVGGGGELVVRYGTRMVGRVMVIAAVVASFTQKKELKGLEEEIEVIPSRAIKVSKNAQVSFVFLVFMQSLSKHLYAIFLLTRGCLFFFHYELLLVAR